MLLRNKSAPKTDCALGNARENLCPESVLSKVLEEASTESALSEMLEEICA